MPTGWFPQRDEPQDRSTRHDCSAPHDNSTPHDSSTPHDNSTPRPARRRGVAPAATAPARSRRRRRHQVLQADCLGVFVCDVTLRERIGSRLLADRLDRTLAAGIEPETDVLLALRAQRIACASARRELAATLRRIVDAACTTAPSPFASPCMAVLPRVVAARRDIEALIAALLAPAPLSAHGVARVRLLLRDGGGPLYRYEARGDLGAQVRAATAALDPTLDWL